METLVYVLGFIIGALGTSFFLYYRKTRKLLLAQHRLVLDLTLALIGKDDIDIEKKSAESSKKEDEKKD
jgi:hypothetical protein